MVHPDLARAYGRTLPFAPQRIGEQEREIQELFRRYSSGNSCKRVYI